MDLRVTGMSLQLFDRSTWCEYALEASISFHHKRVTLKEEKCSHCGRLNPRYDPSSSEDDIEITEVRYYPQAKPKTYDDGNIKQEDAPSPGGSGSNATPSGGDPGIPTVTAPPKRNKEKRHRTAATGATAPPPTEKQSIPLAAIKDVQGTAQHHLKQSLQSHPKKTPGLPGVKASFQVQLRLFHGRHGTNKGWKAPDDARIIELENHEYTASEYSNIVDYIRGVGEAAKIDANKACWRHDQPTPGEWGITIEGLNATTGRGKLVVLPLLKWQGTKTLHRILTEEWGLGNPKSNARFQVFLFWRPLQVDSDADDAGSATGGGVKDEEHQQTPRKQAKPVRIKREEDIQYHGAEKRDKQKKGKQQKPRYSPPRLSDDEDVTGQGASTQQPQQQPHKSSKAAEAQTREEMTDKAVPGTTAGLPLAGRKRPASQALPHPDRGDGAARGTRSGGEVRPTYSINIHALIVEKLC